MNAEQIVQRIDEQGYIVLQKGVGPELVAKYLELIQQVKPKGGWSHKADVLHLDPVAFTQVLLQKRLQKVIRGLCGDHARLDHHFLLSYPGGKLKPNVHGGPFSEHCAVHYHTQGGIKLTSNLKIGIALQRQGGPGVIPGTHKIDEAYPQERRRRHFRELVVPGMKPGAIVIFTDALFHGTPDVDGFRQMLYYTFTPGHVAWARYEPWPAEVMQKLPEEIRGYFRPPGLVQWGKDDRWKLQWAEPSIGAAK